MAKWWKATAWPWLKENWWAVLLAPLALFVLAAMISKKFFSRSPDGAALLTDPLGPADERELTETKTRLELMAKENDRLADQLKEAQTRYEELQASFEARLEARIQSLRNDPEALKRYMLRVGPGGRP